MTVPHSPLASPIKRPTTFPDFAQEELKKPLNGDVEAGITVQKIVSPKTPGRVGIPGFRRLWRSFVLIVGILLASLILINALVIILGLIDLL